MDQSSVCFGRPFDPTLDKYFVELSPQTKKDLRREAVKILKMNYYQKPEELTLNALLDIVNKITVKMFRQRMDLQNVDKNSLSEDFKRQYRIIKKLKSRKANRYFFDFFMDYDKVSHIQITNQHGEQEPDGWVKAHSHAVMNLSDTYEVHGNPVAIKELKLSSAATKILDYSICINDSEDEKVEAVLRLCLKALDDKINVADALLGTWGICKLGRFEPFILVFKQYRDLITPEEFPFLNFSVLDYISAELDKGSIDDPSITNYEEEIQYAFLDKLTSEIVSDKPFNLKLFHIEKHLNNEVYKADYAEIMAGLNNALDEFVVNLSNLDLISTASMVKFKGYAQYFKDKFNNVTTSEEYALAEQLVTKFVNDATPLADSFMEYFEDLKGLYSLKDSIVEESQGLSGDPLNNFDKIAELKNKHDDVCEQLSGIQEKIKSLESALVSSFSAFGDEAIKVSIQKDKANTELSSEIDELKSLKEELDAEKLLVEQLKLENKKLKSLNHSITQEIENKPNFEVAAAPASLPKELMSSLLSGSATMQDMFSLLKHDFAHRFELSSQAARSIRECKQFNSLGTLYTKLSTLFSDEFFEKFSARGSIGAFELFTKKELSFQESKTVKEAKDLRLYEFEGGNKIECFAHLRMGVDNSQHKMIRVYFCIKDGVFYIGDVTSHAPVVGKV